MRVLVVASAVFAFGSPAFSATLRPRAQVQWSQANLSPLLKVSPRGDAFAIQTAAGAVEMYSAATGTLLGVYLLPQGHIPISMEVIDTSSVVVITGNPDSQKYLLRHFRTGMPVKEQELSVKLPDASTRVSQECNSTALSYDGNRVILSACDESPTIGASMMYMSVPMIYDIAADSIAIRKTPLDGGLFTPLGKGWFVVRGRYHGSTYDPPHAYEQWSGNYTYVLSMRSGMAGQTISRTDYGGAFFTTEDWSFSLKNDTLFTRSNVPLKAQKIDISLYRSFHIGGSVYATYKGAANAADSLFYYDFIHNRTTEALHLLPSDTTQQRHRVFSQDGSTLVVATAGYVRVYSLPAVETPTAYKAYIAAPVYPTHKRNQGLFVPYVYPADSTYTLQWYLNDVPVGNVDSLRYTFNEPGSYRLRLEATNARGLKAVADTTLHIHDVEDVGRTELELPGKGTIVFTNWVAADSILVAAFDDSAKRMLYMLMTRSQGQWAESRRWTMPSQFAPVVAKIENAEYTRLLQCFSPSGSYGKGYVPTSVITLPDSSDNAIVEASQNIPFEILSFLEIKHTSTLRLSAWYHPLSGAVHVASDMEFTVVDLSRDYRPTLPSSRALLYRYIPSTKSFDVTSRPSHFSYGLNSFLGGTDNHHLVYGTPKGRFIYAGDTVLALPGAYGEPSSADRWDNTFFGVYNPPGISYPDHSPLALPAPASLALSARRVGTQIAVLRKDLDTPVVFFDANSGLRTRAVVGTYSVPRLMEVSPQHNEVVIVGAGSRMEFIRLQDPELQLTRIDAPTAMKPDSAYKLSLGYAPARESDVVRWLLDGVEVGAGPTLTLSLSEEKLYTLRAAIERSGRRIGSPGVFLLVGKRLKDHDNIPDDTVYSWVPPDSLALPADSTTALYGAAGAPLPVYWYRSEQYDSTAVIRWTTRDELLVGFHDVRSQSLRIEKLRVADSSLLLLRRWVLPVDNSMRYRFLTSTFSTGDWPSRIAAVGHTDTSSKWRRGAFHTHLMALELGTGDTATVAAELRDTLYRSAAMIRLREITETATVAYPSHDGQALYLGYSVAGSIEQISSSASVQHALRAFDLVEYLPQSNTLRRVNVGLQRAKDASLRQYLLGTKRLGDVVYATSEGSWSISGNTVKPYPLALSRAAVWDPRDEFAYSTQQKIDYSGAAMALGNKMQKPQHIVRADTLFAKFSADTAEAAQMISAERGLVVRTARGLPWAPFSAAASPDSRYIALGGSFGSLMIIPTYAHDKRFVVSSGDVSVYPNPAAAFVRFDFSEPVAHLAVWSVQGQEVFSQKIPAEKIFSWDLINTSGTSLLPGRYTVVATTTSGKLLSAPLVIMP